MKLTKLHLFLIIIAVLIASTLGFSVKEYFENKDSKTPTDSKGDRVNKALEYGSSYDPFGSDSDQKNSDKKSYDGEYDTTIGDLEELVSKVPMGNSPDWKLISGVLCNSIVEWASQNANEGGKDLLQHLQSDIGYLMERLGLTDS